MPQFDFSTYASQIFWLVLCFAAFSSYTLFFTIPKLKKMFKTRHLHIEGYEHKALRNLDEIQKIEQKINELIKTTYIKSNDMIVANCQDLETNRLKYNNELRTEFKKQIYQFETALKKEEKQIYVEIDDKIEKMGNLVILKLNNTHNHHTVIS